METFAQRQNKRRAHGKPFRANPGTETRHIRDSAAWDKLSRSIRNRFPLCLDPFGHHAADGVTVGATEVHHIVPIDEAPDRALDQANLAQLCRACHERAERADAGERAKMMVMVRDQLEGEEWTYV